MAESNQPDQQSTSGRLPAWGTADLPEPLPFSLANTFRTIGPGAILLVGAIGMGEWIAGPMFAVKYGRGILWIATVAFVLQSLLNLEAVRYTLYTGEPIITGFMRLRPSPRFWGAIYMLAAIAQLGLPAGAASCAGVVFALGAGRAPVMADHRSVAWITVALVLVVAAILASGRKVERLLETLSWGMIAVIFAFLVLMNVVFVPASEWGRTFAGFFRFGELPSEVDFVMLAVFAALAGAGGVGNLAIASWFRDKGFGMGALTGGLGGVRAKDPGVAANGIVFPINAVNLARWRGWWRYSMIDQSVLWAGGCVIGMFLTVNVATGIFTRGLDVAGVAAGVFQAAEMRKLWEGFWLIALVNGFWILFSTALTNVDILTRLVTDILWAGAPKARRIPAGRLYGLVLLAFTLVAVAGSFLGNAGVLLGILGATAAPIMAFSAVQILWVNCRLLPAELRPPIWRRAGLVLCAVFYGAVSFGILRQLLM